MIPFLASGFCYLAFLLFESFALALDRLSPIKVRGLLEAHPERARILSGAGEVEIVRTTTKVLVQVLLLAGLLTVVSGFQSFAVEPAWAWGGGLFLAGWLVTEVMLMRLGAANDPERTVEGLLPVITAASWLDVKTLPDLVALAKKRPDDLTYGTNGPGRLTHLTGELLASRAGIKLLMIPYSGGTAQVLTDVMGKRVPLVIEAYSGLAGAIQGGTVVPLAVASPKRLASFPNVPTVAETLPGFEAGGWQVVLAPTGTPDAIVQKVNADLIKALSDPDTRKRLARFHRDERLLSPAETAAFIQGEQKMWAPVLKQIAAGAK